MITGPRASHEHHTPCLTRAVIAGRAPYHLTRARGPAVHSNEPPATRRDRIRIRSAFGAMRERARREFSTRASAQSLVTRLRPIKVSTRALRDRSKRHAHASLGGL